MKERLLLLACLSLWLVSCSYEKVEETVEIGYRGEARRNPFLAAQKLYEESGHEATSSLRLDDMPWDSTLLIMPGASITTPSRASQIQEWIEDGGHLVYLLEGWGYLPWTGTGDTYGVPDISDHPLLKAFEVGFGEMSDRSSRLSFELDEHSGELRFPQGPTFDVTNAFEVEQVLGEKDKAHMASMSAGYGRLTLLSTAYPIRNRAIAKLDHAEFALGLVELNASDEVLFVYASDLSFWGMLWRSAWMPLLGLIVLLIAWLWKVLPSFGPRLPPAEVLPRHFTDHLLMTAQFLWRHGSPNGLLDPVRRRLTKRYQTLTGRSLPSFADAEFHEYLEENSALSKERIHDAMLGNPQKDANGFTRLVQDLNQLETSL